MTDKKALFLDMDGTTLNDSHQMSEENREALKRMIQAGHEVVITTGRPLASADYLLKTYSLDKIGCKYMIVYNGGQILDCVSREILYSKTMPLSWVQTLVERAREEHVYLQTYEGDHILTEQDDENLAHYTKKTSMKAQVVADLTASLKEEPCKALAIHLNNHEILEQFCSKLTDWASDKLDMYFSCREYLEIVPKGVSKGNALKAFCEREKIPITNAISVGDENNDLSMILEAGIGCAVANAQDNVKAAADYVTKRDNNHSAIQEVVEKFILC